MRIAVDAMGGDFAPAAIVHGGIDAVRFHRHDFEVVFVGDEEQIKQEIARHFFTGELPISIVHASEKIEMNESPMLALKQKKDSSIAVAMRLHREGKVDAVLSAGNTGAVMAAALLTLGHMQGVSRPAIASILPNERGKSLVIDVGANVDCKPPQLLQFGIMGSIFMSHLFELERPRVALLNIGEEDSKGNEAALGAYRLLQESPLNFIGNIEGRNILRDATDVVVCDGFVGNIILKFAESIDGVYSSNLKRKIGKKIFSQIGAFLLQPTFDGLRKIFDYQEYGGAPLLGVNGVCIICHGKSTPKAIKNAIREAERMVTGKINDHIRQQLEVLNGAKVE